ncbi:MAG: L,D-transpeptidase [Cyanobacteria bacterium P01_D01_bin.1]
MNHNAPSQSKRRPSSLEQSIQEYRRLICRSAALFGSIAVGVLSATSVLAETPVFEQTASEQTAAEQITLRQQERLTLSELINSVPERPIPVLPMPEEVVPAAVESGGPNDLEAIGEEAAETIRLVLRLGERRVYVYRGETVEESYPVAIGRKGWETPTGEFEVFDQISEPGWTNPFTNEVMGPGPNNPLGDRWIAFWTDGNNSIGFHGTPNRDSVGKAASHGCVRMYNEDVKELFEIVAIGTPVTVEM